MRFTSPFITGRTLEIASEKFALPPLLNILLLWTLMFSSSTNSKDPITGKWSVISTGITPEVVTLLGMLVQIWSMSEYLVVRFYGLYFVGIVITGNKPSSYIFSTNSVIYLRFSGLNKLRLKSPHTTIGRPVARNILSFAQHWSIKS